MYRMNPIPHFPLPTHTNTEHTSGSVSVRQKARCRFSSRGDAEGRYTTRNLQATRAAFSAWVRVGASTKVGCRFPYSLSKLSVKDLAPPPSVGRREASTRFTKPKLRVFVCVCWGVVGRVGVDFQSDGREGL